ncbi:MAG: RodZ domain-containing protein, partial [Acidimicrobiales bacterium]
LVLAVAGAATALVVTDGSGPPTLPSRPQPSAATPPAAGGSGTGSPGKAPSGSSSRAATAHSAEPVTPASADGAGASYRLATSSFTVVLKASGPCWVEEKAGASGQPLWTGTLTAGASRAFPATDSLWLRLGDPANVHVSLGGVPVRFPASGAHPLNLSFTFGVAST